MVMTDSVTESVTKVSGLSYKHKSFIKMTVTKFVSESVFSKLEVIPINMKALL